MVFAWWGSREAYSDRRPPTRRRQLADRQFSPLVASFAVNGGDQLEEELDRLGAHLQAFFTGPFPLELEARLAAARSALDRALVAPPSAVGGEFASSALDATLSALGIGLTLRNETEIGAEAHHQMDCVARGARSSRTDGIPLPARRARRLRTAPSGGGWNLSRCSRAQ
jgi:hypothetical protein